MPSDKSLRYPGDVLCSLRLISGYRNCQQTFDQTVTQCYHFSIFFLMCRTSFNLCYTYLRLQECSLCQHVYHAPVPPSMMLESRIPFSCIRNQRSLVRGIYVRMRNIVSIFCSFTLIGRCPAACAASRVKYMPFFFYGSAPISGIGWSSISLFAYIIVTRRVSDGWLPPSSKRTLPFLMSIKICYFVTFFPVSAVYEYTALFDARRQ